MQLTYLVQPECICQLAEGCKDLMLQNPMLSIWLALLAQFDFAFHCSINLVNQKWFCSLCFAMFLGYVLHKLNQFVFKEFVLYVFWKMFHFCCMSRWQSLIEEIRAVSNIGQKGQFFWKKDTKNLSISYSILF